MIVSEQMNNFSEQIYSLLKQVPKGQVTTYKAVAEAINTKAYRAVGQVLKNNPFAPTVPCHRVVSSDGKIGGFMGKKTGPNIEKKITLLRKEGVVVENYRVKDFDKILFDFKKL